MRYIKRNGLYILIVCVLLLVVGAVIAVVGQVKRLSPAKQEEPSQSASESVQQPTLEEPSSDASGETASEQAPVWEREAQQKLSVSVSESGFEGLFCYEGRFPELPDTDAAVFACVDGVWYESCLTEDGFRLLAPEAESVQLVTTAAESASIYQAELTN